MDNFARTASPGVCIVWLSRVKAAWEANQEGFGVDDLKLCLRIFVLSDYHLVTII